MLYIFEFESWGQMPLRHGGLNIPCFISLPRRKEIHPARVTVVGRRDRSRGASYGKGSVGVAKDHTGSAGNHVVENSRTKRTLGRARSAINELASVFETNLRIYLDRKCSIR